MRRSPAVPAVAAAIALAATGCSSSGPVAGHPDTSAPAHGTVVTCTTGATLTPAQLAAAKKVLLARADAASTQAAAIDTSGPHSIAVVQPGFDRALAPQFCRTGSLQFRPVVAPPMATPGGRCAASSNTASAQESACSADGRSAYPLGPVILDNAGIASARAATDSVQPTLAITLTTRAGAAWATWTQAHNANGQASTPVEQCSPATTPCADYVAFVLDGVVVSAPVTLQPITGGTIQVAGSFTSAQTKVLAAQFSAGALPATFRLQSVTSR